VKALFSKLSDWQHWPFYLFYFPISYIWLWYYLRTKSLWFFTSSNPTLAFGGFEGEGKSVMCSRLPPEFCVPSVYVEKGSSISKVLEAVEAHKLSYPFIVKPDVGMKGILFRKIESEAQLILYHERMPAKYIIQPFLDTAIEVSVFYCRLPSNSRGMITALIQKNLFTVQGDGISTLQQLVERSFGPDKHLLRQHQQHLKKVLAKGEHYVLSYIANLVNGAQFINLTHLVDQELVSIFDRISHQADFFYGRYDIKCNSVEDLKVGNFKILEFNGAGSVPNHIYTGTFTLTGAYREILYHWRLMYQISKENNRKGYRYWSFNKGRLFLKRSKQHFKLLQKIDRELVLE
jgi:hypothetical protein